NRIFELAVRPDTAAVQDAVGVLGSSYPQTLAAALFIGRVIDEYKSRIRRNDFLISNVSAVDRNRGAIAMNGSVRVGQTIRLHARDARTASEEADCLAQDRKSTRLNSSHVESSYAVFCLKKKKRASTDNRSQIRVLQIL